MENTKKQRELKRSLKSRHMSMIAIGGSIGTGLFLASGSTFSSAGPGGALLAFSMMGVMVFFLVTSLGEMSTMIPVSGSFETFASRFIDPALGFALGWNYWFCWAITLAVEITAGAIVIQYWLPNTNAAMWSGLFLLLLFGLNYLSARAFGESEFWFAGIKVVTVVIFIVVGVLMIFGIMGGASPGFSNWVLSDGAGNKGPFIGGFAAIPFAFLTAGFSFRGTEIVALAAGEAENPEKTVPKAIHSVFWRILIFYIGTIVVIGFLIPFTDPNLLRTDSSEIAFSPFTMIFSRAGIAGAASIMNAVILTSVLSCGNSSLYASSRMIFAMAQDGKAPKFLAKINKRGVPVNALILTAAISLSVFLSSFVGSGKIYFALYNISAVSGFIIWLGIALSHYRFRKAYLAQGRKLSDLKFKAKLYPVGPILAIILSLLIIFGANVGVFQAKTFSWFDFFTSYGVVPAFLCLYLGYKLKYKTKLVPLTECDFSSERIE